jgi:hypothetical protein
MITKWLLLFLENDFLIIYQLGQSHLVVDVLYKLPNITENLGVPNQTTNVLYSSYNLFGLQEFMMTLSQSKTF